MPSLIAGYNYDVFISYRQKDNKYDGWVTNFVDHLKAELESTFKEEISVYFDINPHDGLLETYDVDASLKEKLKCLVFIPIISRTYCDPRSFAWENEFKAFIRLSSDDNYGLKIRLISGNVANRILPVKIHELDEEDRILLEGELGGNIRGIEFIYQEPGVNRPLTTSDDDRKNLNNTNYRNQINKTANAVKEIISSLKKHDGDGGISNVISQPGDKRFREFVIPVKHLRLKFKPKVLYSFIFILLCAALSYFILRDIKKDQNTRGSPKQEKTIAVLPFVNMGDDNEHAWFGDAITDEIITQLYKINELKVRSRTSVMRYRSSSKPIPSIGKELNANYIIEGSTQIFRDQIKIRVQLIDARKDEPLWGDTFSGSWDDLLKMQTEIAMQTASNLKAVLTPEEKLKIAKDPTKNSTAYMNYLSANVLSDNALYYLMVGNKFVDSISFFSAIKMYDRAIENDPGFALAYARRAIARSWGFYVRQLDKSHIEKCRNDINAALNIDKDLVDAQIALGFYYFYCLKDNQKALLHFRNASEKSPGNYQPIFYMAMVYRKTGNWGKSNELVRKVIEFEPHDALVLTNIGLSFDYMRKYDSAIIFQNLAIEIMPNWSAPYINKMNSILLNDGDIHEARKIIDSAVLKTGKDMPEKKIVLNIYEGKYEEAFDLLSHTSSDAIGSKSDKYLMFAQICNLLKKKELVALYSDSACTLLRKYAQDHADDAYAQSSLGLAYAFSGDRMMAVESGLRSVELAGTDKLMRSELLEILAKIYVITGNLDEALVQVNYLLKNPSVLSLELMKIDPDWKTLINSREFKTTYF